MSMWIWRVRLLLADVPKTISGAIRMWAIRAAVDRGRRAAMSGRDHVANPYREKVPHLRAAWGRGYRQGIVDLTDPGGRA